MNMKLSGQGTNKMFIIKNAKPAKYKQKTLATKIQEKKKTNQQMALPTQGKSTEYTNEMSPIYTKNNSKIKMPKLYQYLQTRN